MKTGVWPQGNGPETHAGAENCCRVWFRPLAAANQWHVANLGTSPQNIPHHLYHHPQRPFAPHVEMPYEGKCLFGILASSAPAFPGCKQRPVPHRAFLTWEHIRMAALGGEGELTWAPATARSAASIPSQGRSLSGTAGEHPSRIYPAVVSRHSNTRRICPPHHQTRRHPEFPCTEATPVYIVCTVQLYSPRAVCSCHPCPSDFVMSVPHGSCTAHSAVHYTCR